MLEQGDLSSKLGESIMSQNVIRNSKMVTVDKIELLNKKLLENMFSLSELEQKVLKLQDRPDSPDTAKLQLNETNAGTF